MEEGGSDTGTFDNAARGSAKSGSSSSGSGCGPDDVDGCDSSSSIARSEIGGREDTDDFLGKGEKIAESLSMDS